MKAIQLIDGVEDKIELSDVPKPEPQSGEVLVRIKAAALNRRDQWIRQGMYPGIRFGSVLGSDGAGVVEDLGDGADPKWLDKEVLINPNVNWGEKPAHQAADYRVLGMPDHGTLAEYICVHTDKLHEKPALLNWEQAAALPLGGLTAYRATFHHGQVKAGDKVLISGIGGGVAQFAFQFALATQAEVYVTSGNEQKLRTAKEMGASGAFNYRNEGWQKALFKASGGFDCVIDSAGGDQINDFIRMMRPAGRIVFYGATNGTPQKLDLFRMFWNQITLQGSTMGNDQEFVDMISFVEQHQIKPIIDSVRPIDEAVSAFNDMRDGRQFGKLVIRVTD